MFATSPAAVVRSVPTMQRSTRPSLHQMAAGIVDDDRVRDAVLAEFPGGQAGALVARPGLVDPDMDRDAVVMGAVDRRERGAPIDRGEPAGIAMRQDLDPAGRALAPPRLGDQRGAVLADRAVDRDIRLGDLAGPRQGRGKPACLPATSSSARCISASAQRRLTAVGRVAASLDIAASSPASDGSSAIRERHAVGRGGADQRRAAHLHRRDRARRILERLQPRRSRARAAAASGR